MTIGSSLFLIAVGGILKYAVKATVAGFSIQNAGVILMVAGVVGLIVGLMFHDPGPRGTGGAPRGAVSAKESTA